MKIYKTTNVFDEAVKRINRIFDEFPTVIASVSGGKDSTVIFNLALQIARERGRLPLKVFFIDEEAEWSFTIEMIRYMMYHPDVKPYWYQIPIKIENAATFSGIYQEAWKEGVEWLRPKEDIAIKENTYGVDIWDGIFKAITNKDFPEKGLAMLTGMRAEETPKRMLAVTETLTYKDITWGKVLNKNLDHYTFHPIYDWSYTDVWKAIHDNKWKYNKLYDIQYQKGIPVSRMRVSNLHHETAVHSLFILQEIDSDLYNALCKRMPGVDTAGKMGSENFFIKKLPFMFKDWKEYRDYLLEKLILDENLKKVFAKKFKEMDEKYSKMPDLTPMYKVMINSIIANDIALTKIVNWERSLEVHLYRQFYLKNKKIIFDDRYTKYIRKEDLEKLRG